jgi:hypothetical protein
MVHSEHDAKFFALNKQVSFARYLRYVHFSFTSEFIQS